MNLGEENLIYLKASTSAFVLLVFVQMANAMNCRSLSQSIFTLGLFSNRWLWGAILTSIVTIILFVEVPFFQKALHTTSLSLQEWLMLSSLGLSIIVVEELRKAIQNKLYFKTKNA
jgi:magnesium-transporting ATPase (P-type)